MKKLIVHFIIVMGLFLLCFKLFSIFFTSMDPALFFGIPNEAILIGSVVLSIAYMLISRKRIEGELVKTTGDRVWLGKTLRVINIVAIFLFFAVLIFFALLCMVG